MQIFVDTEQQNVGELRALITLLQTIIGTKLEEPTALPDEVAKQLAAGVQPIINPADHPDAGQVIPPLTIPVLPLPSTPPILTQHTAASAIELDSRGLPWDSRIHSSTKKKTEKGTWATRKGVGSNQVLINQVEAELRATLPQTTPQAATPAPVFPQAPAVAPTVTLPPIPVVAPTTPTAPLPTLAPALSLPPAPPVPSVPATFAELTQALQPQMLAGKITPDVMNMACMQVGVPGMMALHTATPDQIGAIFKALST